ncbi:hypothetical protein K0M00_004705 [Escherichia coli]|nr:hypothetical protein [Escherichia coli]EHV4443607.1 hypothetical protein [Escherichia coli]WGM49369.1 hypothetical protein EcMJ_127 [Escherichia phage vB_Ec-M-J]
MFEMIKIMQRCIVDQHGIYGYSLSAAIDKNKTTYVSYNSVLGFDIFIDANNKIKQAKDVSIMTPDELFQYSLVLPTCIDLQRLGAIQKVLREHKVQPNKITHIPETFYKPIEVETPDYMLSDDEFYKKHFPGKVWRD